MLESVPFFHIAYMSAIRMGVQLPLKTESSPLPLQLAAISRSISIQRQLFEPQPQPEKIFICSYLIMRCKAGM